MVAQPAEFAGSCCSLASAVIFVIALTGTAQEVGNSVILEMLRCSEFFSVKGFSMSVITVKQCASEA